jgi:hypothetical protein
MAGPGGTIEGTDFLHASSHAVGAPDRVVSFGSDSPDRMETLPRGVPDGMTAVTVGALDLAFITSPINKTVNALRAVVGNTGYVAGTGGPATWILVLYRVNGDQSLTRLAQTDPIPGSTAAPNSVVTQPLDVAVDLLYGQRYAIGLLWLDNGETGGTLPQFYRYESTGPNSAVRSQIMSLTPRMTGRLSGQSGSPASITDASLAALGYILYLSAVDTSVAGA